MFPVLVILLAVLCPKGEVRAMEITPFATFNQSPLVQIYGLPAAEGSTIVPSVHLTARLSLDMASNFTISQNGLETMTLDGETYRTTLALRYGLRDGVEIGMDIPTVVKGGGFIDNSIIAFHDFFKIDQNGRDTQRRNRLRFRYEDRNGERFYIMRPNGGIGDIRLLGGVQLYHNGKESPRAVALRASLKLPTGDSGNLNGSGSTDFALWLSATDANKLQMGHWSLFGAVGAMITSTGNVLPDKQRHLAGFGNIGIGWSPLWWLAFKTQLNWNTPMYKQSSLKELNVTSIQWIMGPTIAFSPRIALDLGVSEDILVNSTSPDFGINMALHMLF
ncbi:MAG: DUF3187 family protein [Geobacteraceae bacterium]